MKKLFLAAILTITLVSCRERYLIVDIDNDPDIDRSAEMVEIDLDSLPECFAMHDYLYVTDESGREIPSQITHDRKLIFASGLKKSGKISYRINGSDKPHYYDTIAKGRVYPERDDDMAWENDIAGFRAYGPALQNRGERGYGYDIFLKRDTIYPILDMLYALELNPESWMRADSIRRIDGNEAADDYINTFSYHIDHGYGMDCYAVGPTLGAGTSALMENDRPVYPWCYKDAEILDNGPLRFTVRLSFTPLNVNKDSAVIETRVITIDAGSHLNKTAVYYSGLTSTTPIATGIVLHDTEGATYADTEHEYISYIEPTQQANVGKVFMGAAFPVRVAEIKVDRHETKPSHLLAITPYNPGDIYNYYWGFAWDRTDIKTFDEWNDYLARHVKALQSPLKIEIRH